MCEFCGCGEPPYRSVTVVVPTVDTTEGEAPVAVVASGEDEESDD